MEETKQPNKVLLGIIIAVILVAIAGAAVALSGQKETSAPAASQDAPSTSEPSSDDTAATTGSYKNGIYKADGTYQSPGGNEIVHLTVTLSDGTITATEFTTDASGGTAREYQEKFIGGYKSFVVGKKIGEIKLDRVAGSSLTSSGFNRALDQIKSDAKA